MSKLWLWVKFLKSYENCGRVRRTLSRAELPHRNSGLTCKSSITFWCFLCKLDKDTPTTKGKVKIPWLRVPFCQTSPHFRLMCHPRDSSYFCYFVMYIRQITRCNLSQLLELNLPLHTAPVIAFADYSFSSTFSHRCSSPELPRLSPNTMHSVREETCRNPGSSETCGVTSH